MQVDPESVIRQVGEMGLIDIIRPVGDWYMCRCPIHSGGAEKKPSCGISLHEQFRNGKRYPPLQLHCFSCNYTGSLSNALTEVLKRKGIGKSGIDWLKENIPGFEDEDVEFDYLIPKELSSSLQSSYALDYINSRIISESKQYVPDEELASYRLTVPYMYQRGLTDEIIEKYDIGYDANFIPPGRKKPMPCVTFPVRDINGKTLFLCRRSVQGKFFHYPQGVEKSVYGLYELPKGVKSVVVCESCFNALTCIKWGYPAVALLGTGTSYEINQLKRLGVQEFVLCLDGDDAGQKGIAKLKKALGSVAIVWAIKMPVDKDVNDCTKEEFETFYAARE
jgi:DNA primase